MNNTIIYRLSRRKLTDFLEGFNTAIMIEERASLGDLAFVASLTGVEKENGRFLEGIGTTEVEAIK